MLSFYLIEYFYLLFLFTFYFFLQVQLASEKQRYEQLSQQSDADRTAAALAMETATKKFSLDLAEALNNAKSENEKELGAERERMSMVRSCSETCTAVLFLCNFPIFSCYKIFSNTSSFPFIPLFFTGNCSYAS